MKTENLFIEIWAENLRTKHSYRVQRIITNVNACSKRAISQTLGNYLLEQAQLNTKLRNHNLNEKLQELEKIKEVFDQDALELEIYGLKYFIRYSNFEPAL